MTASCVFFGTPEFALPALDALLASDYDVRAVVTRPDRPAGRGRRLRPSPVKQRALDAGIAVLQPPRLRSPEAVTAITALEPDFAAVSAYGLLIPPEILRLPAKGVLNIHPSLLPRHRGASPIPAAILSGDEVTGVTIMLMDEGLDTGPVLTQQQVAIGPNEDAGSLSRRLAAVSGGLLVTTIERWLGGEIEAIPQNPEQASYSGQLEKDDSTIDWTQPARSIWLQVRAFNPWPSTETTIGETRLRLLEAWPLTTEQPGASPGTVLRVEAVASPDGPVAGAVVASGSGELALLRVQKEGKRPLSIDQFVLGEREFVGNVLGSRATPSC
ncbi:MAG: methionyl-tRNA formyltransferase [Dehalococcoidia bacterium]|nr:methionyl-tRNA formyltransferase [Dehalococcoidia bacterium]